MAFGLGIAGMVKLRLGAERVQDTQHAPARKSAVGKTATLTQSSGNKSSNPSFRHCQKRDRHLKKKFIGFREEAGREEGEREGRSEEEVLQSPLAGSSVVVPSSHSSKTVWAPSLVEVHTGSN